MKKQPNILLITSDQERYPLGFPENVPLPARQWLYRNGTTFEQYYVTTAPCAPSRSCMYTGQHVPHTGMFDNAGFPFVTDLADKEGLKTIGHMLREQGITPLTKESGISLRSTKYPMVAGMNKIYSLI